MVFLLLILKETRYNRAPAGVLKYEAENPVDLVSGTKHDNMHLFELVVNAVN